MATARCEQWCALSSSQYSCKVRKDSANYTQRYSSFENLNISETKQDIEKLKAPLSLVRKCCSVAITIRSTIFPLQWHFKYSIWQTGRKLLILTLRVSTSSCRTKWIRLRNGSVHRNYWASTCCIRLTHAGKAQVTADQNL